LDPIHFNDTSYYLVPDGAAGQKPYALLMKAMQDKSLYCIAHVVLHNKDQLVVVRPVHGVMCMTSLKYAGQIKQSELFTDDIVDTDVSKDEYKLAERLIEDSIDTEFDLASYPDKYTDRLSQLIEAKVEGKEIVAAPATDAPPVINLMDALRASVEQSQASSSGRARSRSASPLKKKVAKAKRKPAAKAKKSASKTAAKSGKRLQKELSRPKPKKTKTLRIKKTG
jgi:DNA end-binding protein Ku